MEYIPGIHDQGKMLVLPNRLLYWVVSTSDQCFVSFQQIWCHPHTQKRITLFHGVRKNIPNWKPFPNRAAIEFSQIAFPITVLLQDGPYRCRSRGTTGSKSTLSKSLITLWDCLRLWIVVRWWTNFTFFSTTGLSGLSGVWIVFPRTETIRSHKSRAGIPSNLNPASKEMISDSVELCETEVCFLHIQLIGTNLWLPKTHKVPPEVGFWVFKISRKVRVLKQSQSALFCSVTHITTLLVFTCMMNVRDQTRQTFFHKLSSTSWWHEQACFQTIKCQVYQFEPVIDISEQFESMYLTILQQILLLLLWNDGHQCME